MSKYGGNNRIDFGVHFNTDKSSLADIQKAFQKLQDIKPANFKGSVDELRQIKLQALKVQAALTKAFNVKLGSLNVDAFKKELNGLNIDKIYTDLAKLGSQGQVAFSKMATSMMTTNLQLKETHSLINSMGTTMMNTVKWGIASSVMNNFTSSVSQAFQYVKSLDSALTDIRIVTGDSTEKMAQFADQANRAAQELGRSTMDYSKAALTFYQQGLSDEDVAARTEATLKAQNITGAGEEMANYLTAVWNGYKVANEEAELYVDKLAAVADSSASNMSQLAVAMSKVASTANMLGVPVDSLNAQIATIVATTRQAPQSVGNALKTIYARINDIATGADDAEISLGNYSSKMAELGINVLDSNGKLRDTGDVIEQIGGKWEGLSREQQIYLARTMAGQRQYNNLLALFENWGKYTDLVNVSMQSQGTTMQKNSRYMDSLAAHMEQLGAAGERVKSAMIDSDSFKGLIDVGTNITNLFANLIESIGGGGTAFLALGSIITQVFSGVIAKEITSFINNLNIARENEALLQADIAATNQLKESQAYQDGTIKASVDAKVQAQKYYQTMSQGQIEAYNGIVNEISAVEQEKIVLQEAKEASDKLIESIEKAGGTPKVAIENLVNSFDNLKQSFKNINLLDNDDFFSISAELTRFKEQTEQLGIEVPGLSQLVSLFERIKDPVNMDVKQLQLLKEKIEDVKAKAQQKIDLMVDAPEIEGKLSVVDGKLDALKEKGKSFLKSVDTENAVKGMVSFASGIGQVTSGLMSLSNISNILKNDSLSTGQKVLQIMSNLGMSTGMLVNGAKQLVQGWGDVTKVIIKVGTKIIASRSGEAAATAAATGAETAKSAANVVEAETAGVAAGANASLAASFGAILLTAAPYIAAIAAIGVAVYALVKSYNAASDAANKANQIAKQSAEHYNQVKASADELKNSLERYKELQDSFSTMSKGTEQWNTNLQESNQLVLDLIKKFPELAGEVENVHGRLTLSTVQMEELSKKVDFSVEVANASQASLSHQARQASVYSQAVNIGREYRDTSISASGRAQNTQSSQLTGKEVQTLAEYLGNFEKGLYENITSYNELGQKIAKETGIQSDLIKAILGNTEGINSLRDIVAKQKEDEQATRLEAESAVANSSEFQNNAIYKKADDLDKQIMQRFGGEFLLDKQKEIQETWETNIADGINRFSKVTNQTYQDVLDKLNQAGYNLKESTLANAITGTNGNRVLHFDNENGEDQAYRAEEIASIIATSDALKELGASAKQSSNLLNKLNSVNISEGAKEGVKGFITGEGMGSLTQADLKKLQETSINDAFGGSENKEKIAELMGKTPKELEDQYNAMIEATSKRFELMFAKMPVSAATAFKKLGNEFTNISIDAQEGFGKALTQAFETGGSKSLESMQKSIQSLDLKGQDLDNLGQIVGNIDWSNKGSIAQLNSKIEEQGINIDTTSDKWQNFVQELYNSANHAKNAASALNELRGSLQALNNLKDLKAGDILDEEAYNELISKNQQLKQFFTASGEGQYMFLGNQEAVAEILNASADAAIDNFYRMRDAAQQVTSDENLSSQIEELQDRKYRGATEEGRVKSVDDIVQLSKEDAFKNALAVLGLSEDSFNEALNVLNGFKGTAWKDLTESQQQQYKQARDKVKEYLNEINDLQAGYKNGEYDNAHEKEAYAIAAAQSDEALQSLFKYYNEGKIAAQDYQRYREVAINKEIERLGVTREAYDNTAETVEQQLSRVNKNFKNLDKEAKDVEIDQLTSRVIECGQALDEIGNISEDTLDKLQEMADTPTSAEWLNNEDVLKLQESLEQVFNTDIDTSFIAENFDLIRRLANGDVTALNDLQSALAQDYVADLKVDPDLATAQQATNDLQAFIAGIDFDDLEVGMTLDDAGFVQGLEDYAIHAGQYADEINEILERIGFEPQVTDVEIPFSEQNFKQDGTKYYVEVPAPTSQDPTNTRLVQITADQYSSAKASGSMKVPLLAGKQIKYNGGKAAANFSRPNFNSNAAPKSKGSGGKKGGGSSGKPSIAKKNEAKIDAKLKEQENDPYYKVNKSLDKQSTLLKKLQDQEKNLSGKDRLKNLDAQVENLKQQNELLEQRNRISNNVAAVNSTANLRKRLQDAFGKNISFDSEGKIADLNQTERAAVDSYNKAAQQAQSTFESVQKQYNNWILHTWNANSKAWQEAHQSEKEKWDERIKNAETNAKDAISAAEEEYKKKTDLIKAYEKALQEDQKLYEQYMNNVRKIMQDTFEKRKIKIQFKLDSGELERDWLDFENKVIRKIKDSDIVGNAAAQFRELSSYIQSKELQSVSDEIKTISDDIARVNAGAWTQLMGVSQTDYEMLKPKDQQKIREEALGKLEEQLKNLVKQEQDALSAIQDLTDEIAESYLDSIDAAKDALDEHIDQYERINDLIEHNVKLTELLYGDKGYDTLNKYYDLQKQNNMNTLQTLKQQEEYWRSRMQNEVVDSEAWKKFKENLDDAVDAVNSKLEDMLDNLTTQFEKKLAAAVERVNNKLTGGLGTSYLDEQWDYLNNYDDYFLDTYNATTGIEDVTRAYQQALDDAAANPKQQQRLNKLMNDQLKILKEKDHLTEYDLERAKSMLEVEKARMALEDARNNKTKMRLRRDSQGNYTYQYVADEEKLGDLQQALADAQNDLYNQDKEHYKENLNTLYDTYKEYLEKMQELTEEYRQAQAEAEATGNDTWLKQVQARIDLAKEQYDKFYTGLLEDNEYNQAYIAQATANGLNLDLSGLSSEEVWGVIQENVPWAASNIQNLANSISNLGGLLPATNSLLQDFSSAAAQYKADMNDILEARGTSIQTIGQVINEQGGPLDTNIIEANSQVIMGYLDEITQKALTDVDTMQQYTKQLDEYWQTLNKNIQEYINNTREGYNTLQDLVDSSTRAETLDYLVPQINTTSEKGLNQVKEQLSLQNISGEDLNTLYNTYSSYLKNQEMLTVAMNEHPELYEQLASRESLLNEQLERFYTDLVQDMMQQVSSMSIDSQIDQMTAGTSQLLSNLIKNQSLLDQNVHIDANFPNVTSHTQIEEAFNNLVNMAAMRASGYRD